MPGRIARIAARGGALLLLATTAVAQPVDVVEYYHAASGHYFISALEADIDALDAGRFEGWVRTGGTFRAHASATATSSPVCRFYIPPAQGDSHFYSASPAECAETAQKFPTFVAESPSVMHVDLPSAATGTCGPGTVPVYRVWNNRADSNHRYTTDRAVRDAMVAEGWVAEGDGPDAVIMCAAPGGRSRLLVQAWKPDGTAASIGEFAEMTAYRNGNVTGYQNYGVFPLGKPPGTPQVGSDIAPANVDGVDYVAFDIPAHQPLYFTSLWHAPVIGDVFMRADHGGTGIVAATGQPAILELPYQFALSEYAEARRRLPPQPYPTGVAELLAQAAAAIDAANTASTPQARAQASYAALSHVMPLKERLVVEAANASIAAAGRRTDFDLNYEGFGSWTDPAHVAGYEVARDAGFKSVYTVVDWTRVAPAPGVYDFESLDYQIDRARALGFGVALQVNWTPGNLAPWTRDLDFAALKALYYETARLVVSRYRDKVATWYACGEMELDTNGHTMHQMAELARASLAGARAASPGTPFGIYTSASSYVGYQMNPVASPEYHSGIRLLDYMFSTGIDFDFVALQMQYGTIFAPIDVQRFQEVLQETYAVVKVPLVLGETAHSSKTQDYGIPAQSHWHEGFTQQAQYEWADATLRALYALPYVRGYYWVHLDPDDYHPAEGYIGALTGTGLVRADGSVKKVRDAFKDFTTWVQTLAPAVRDGEPASRDE